MALNEATTTLTPTAEDGSNFPYWKSSNVLQRKNSVVSRAFSFELKKSSLESIP